MIENKRYYYSSLSIYQKAKYGQVVCGDTYYTVETQDYLLVAIADGLGSGEEAKKAANQATVFFNKHHHFDVDDLIYACNKQLQGTRGAVVGVMKLYYSSSRIEYAGIGNIQFMLFHNGDQTSRAFPKPGYLDGKPIDVRKDYWPYEKGMSFMMCSDGLEVDDSYRTSVMRIQEPSECIHHMTKRISESRDDVTLIVGKTGG